MMIAKGFGRSLIDASDMFSSASFLVRRRVLFICPVVLIFSLLFACSILCLLPGQSTGFPVMHRQWIILKNVQVLMFQGRVFVNCVIIVNLNKRFGNVDILQIHNIMVVRVLLVVIAVV